MVAFHQGYAGGYADTWIGDWSSTDADNYEWGTWFRYSDGKIRFVFGPDRGKYEGFKDWTRVSPAIRFKPAAQVDVESSVWPILDTLSAESSATCIAAVYQLLTPAFTMTGY